MEEINYKANLENMLIVCGYPGKCKSCGREIWWMTTRQSKKTPFTREGFSHFMDCPDADKFRKKKSSKVDDDLKPDGE